MTLAQRLAALAERAAVEDKALRTLLNGNAADLTALTTTAKASLVAALNEVKALAEAASGNVSALIDDAATTSATKTYSVDKILALVQAAKDELLGGAPSAAIDTIKELGDLLTAEGSAVSAITTALTFRVSVAEAQVFTTEQKLRACQNIGVGDPDADLVAVFEAALV